MTPKRFFLLLLLTITAALATAAAASTQFCHVSGAGTDTAGCGKGRGAAACRSMEYALKYCASNASDNALSIWPGTYAEWNMTLEVDNMRTFVVERDSMAIGEVVIDGAGLGPIMRVTCGHCPYALTGSVVFRGITFANGIGDKDHAGGLSIRSMRNVTLDSCRFVKNTGLLQGLSTNVDSGGAQIWSASIITIRGCIFEGNIAQTQNAYGGGIFMISSGDARFKITDSVFEGNRATFSAAPSTWLGQGSAMGVGMYADENVADMPRARLDEARSVQELVISGCTFRDNVNQGDGSVFVTLYSTTGSSSSPDSALNMTMLVSGNTFERNTCKRGCGLSVSVTAKLSNTHYSAVLSDNKFIDNSAVVMAGGFAWSQNTNPTTLRLSLLRNLFERSTAAIETPQSLGGGAAITFNTDNHLLPPPIIDTLLQDNVWRDCSCGEFGGAFFMTQGSPLGSPSLPAERGPRHVRVIRDRFERNTAGKFGGAMMIGRSRIRDFGAIEIDGAVFIDNKVTNGAAGAVLIIDSERDFSSLAVSVFNVTLRNVIMSGNKAEVAAALTVMVSKPTTVPGSVVRAMGATFLDVSRCSFTNNTATMSGGAMWLSIARGQVTLSDSSYSYNSAAVRGGAIYIDPCDLELLVTRSVFSFNAAPGTRLGGTFYGQTSGKISFDNCQMDLKGISSMSSTALSIPFARQVTFSHNSVLKCTAGCDYKNTTASYLSFSHLGESKTEVFMVIECVPCPPRFYSLERGGIGNLISCHACPNGAECGGGANITARSGFWSSRNVSLTSSSSSVIAMMRCPPRYCDGNRELGICASGRSGRLCGVCEPGRSESMTSPMCVPNSQCGRPMDQFYFALLVMGSVLFFTATMLFQPAGKSGHLRVSVFFFQMLESVSIFVSFSGAFSDEAAAWLRSIRQFITSIAAAKVTSAPTGTAITDLCPFVGLNAIDKIALSFAQPAILALVFGIAYSVVHYWFPSKLERMKPRFAIAMLRLAQYSYTSLLAATLSFLRCVPLPSGVSVLFTNGEVQCGDMWYQYLIGILGMPLLIAFPFFLWALPVLLRRRGLSEGRARVVSALENPYTDNFRWYEAIVIGRRMAILMLASFIPNPVWSSFCVSLLCAIMLAIHMMSHPFSDAKTDLAEAMSLSILLVISIINFFNAGVAEYGSIADGAVTVTIRAMSDIVEVGIVFVVVYSIAVVAFQAVNFVRSRIKHKKDNELLEEDDESHVYMPPEMALATLESGLKAHDDSRSDTVT